MSDEPTVFMCGGEAGPADEAEVAKFREFLAIAGKPGTPGMRRRFEEAGRLDLLDWALCNEPVTRRASDG